MILIFRPPGPEGPENSSGSVPDYSSLSVSVNEPTELIGGTLAGWSDTGVGTLSSDYFNIETGVYTVNSTGVYQVSAIFSYYGGGTTSASSVPLAGIAYSTNSSSMKPFPAYANESKFDVAAYGEIMFDTITSLNKDDNVSLIYNANASGLGDPNFSKTHLTINRLY